MIVGYVVTKIDASRDIKIKVDGPTTISQKYDIKSIEKEEELLVFNFSVSTTYSVNNKEYAYVNLESHIFYKGDDVDKVYDDWNKSRQLNPKVSYEIIEFGLNQSLFETMYLSRSMQLPPLQLVRVEKKEQ
ncbi:MAG: hypothetical protein QXL76_00240 [Candidatus Rehaiarchaeum fermentans]|nr:hypothetical protein [Candidatus Rehaiarchaeum fermentans]